MNAESSPKDPMHGVTLEMIISRLVERYGWAEMGARIKVRCFNFDPSVKSSLTFLRKTPWARKKVEDLYWQYIWETENEAKDTEKSGEGGTADFAD